MYDKDYRETFALRTNMTSISLLQQIAIQYDLLIHHMKVKCAYLNVTLDYEIQGAHNKIPYFFLCGTFIETLVPFEVISSHRYALVVPFQQLLEGPMEALLCECVNDLRQSHFHLLNCLITTASKFFFNFPH